MTKEIIRIPSHCVCMYDDPLKEISDIFQKVRRNNRSCTNNNNDDDVDKMIEFEQDGDGCTVLHSIMRCCYDSESDAHDHLIEAISLLLDMGDRNLVLTTDLQGRTPLHMKLYGTPIEIIRKMISIAGSQLWTVRDCDEKPCPIYRHTRDCNDGTVLQAAFYNEAPTEVLKELITIGGKDLLNGANSNRKILLYAIMYTVSFSIVELILDSFGSDIIFEQDFVGKTALHHIVTRSSEYQPIVVRHVISVLLNIGGSKLLSMQNKLGWTALHSACNAKFSCFHSLSKMIKIGGKDFIMIKDDLERSAIFYISHEDAEAAITIVSMLLEVTGNELLQQLDREGDTVLQYYMHYMTFGHDNSSFEAFEALEAILFKFLQEPAEEGFGIEGVFNLLLWGESRELFREHVWRDFVYILEQVYPKLQTPPSILHAAILTNAPEHVIRDIIVRFDCIFIRDNKGKYPIELAIEKGIAWDKGMKVIIEEITSMENVAARYGIEWESKMKELVNTNVDVIENGSRTDPITGLSPIVLATMCYKSDLNSIFCTLRSNPQLIECSVATTALKKRKRGEEEKTIKRG